MPTPKTVLWDRDPHTGAKHDLLRNYLAAWLPILLPTFRRATYAEGFAGPGVYRGGEPGSPIIALQVIGKHRGLFDGIRHLNLLFVEESAGRCKHLEGQLDQAIEAIGGLPVGVELRPPVTADCASALPELLDESGAWGAPMLVLLDSWGGPDVPHKLLERIARNKAGEVLVTFGPNFLSRFGQDEQHATAGDLAFGDASWRGVFDVASDQKRAFLVQAYRDSLSSAGFSYVLGFEMVDDFGSQLWLMFGTNDKTGLEKMKDAMWDVDPVYGVRYRDPHDPSQMMLDIVDQPDVAPLAAMLSADLRDGARTLDQLRDFALTQTVYRPKHVRPLVQKLLSDGRYIRRGAGQLNGTSVIEFTSASSVAVQPPLFDV